MGVGGAIAKWDSALFAGPLGVVEISFNGYDLAKTVGQSQLTPDMNVKEILYQQLGTKAADHVITGANLMLECVFGEISTKLLSILVPYLIATGGASGAGNDSGTFKIDMYESMLDNVAGPLRVSSVGPSGVPSEDAEDNMFFYQAIPVVNAALIQWEADTQRNLPVQFMIKRRILTTAESTTHESAYGYWGDNTQEDLPAVVWPDPEAPYITAAAASSATAVKLTFNEDLVLIGGVTLTERVVLNVAGVMVVPTAAAIGTDPNDNEIDLTLPASSISAGQEVTCFFTADSVEDADGNNNLFQEVTVTNNVA